MRRMPPRALPWFRFGMLFLIVGSLSLRFAPRVPGVNPDLADGGTGLFYGLAIGCLVVAMVRQRGAR